VSLQKNVTFQTNAKTEIRNITALLEEAVLGIENGVVLFSIPHTTAALLLGEDDEELRADFVRAAENLLAGCEPFTHRKNGNPNAAAHILSAFAGSQLILPVEEGRIVLGTYQNVLFLEMDGPKQRKVSCRLILSN
jgi:secondary thiamine-phosphate synthase enzyme